jgi:hypothetical protein
MALLLFKVIAEALIKGSSIGLHWREADGRSAEIASCARFLWDRGV